MLWLKLTHASTRDTLRCDWLIDMVQHGLTDIRSWVIHQIPKIISGCYLSSMPLLQRLYDKAALPYYKIAKQEASSYLVELG